MPTRCEDMLAFSILCAVLVYWAIQIGFRAVSGKFWAVLVWCVMTRVCVIRRCVARQRTVAVATTKQGRQCSQDPTAVFPGVYVQVANVREAQRGLAPSSSPVVANSILLLCDLECVCRAGVS